MAFTLHDSASVNITNQIATDPPIQVHCTKRNEEVVPERTLTNGESVRWEFKPNFWGTTKYHCDFRWGARFQGFNVWKETSFLFIFPLYGPAGIVYGL